MIVYIDDGLVSYPPFWKGLYLRREWVYGCEALAHRSLEIASQRL